MRRAPGSDLGERDGVDHRARRVGGAREDEALERRRGMRSVGLYDRRHVSLGEGLADLDDVAAERREDVPVGRVAGADERDAVADVERGGAA